MCKAAALALTCSLELVEPFPQEPSQDKDSHIPSAEEFVSAVVVVAAVKDTSGSCTAVSAQSVAVL